MTGFEGAQSGDEPEAEVYDVSLGIPKEIDDEWCLEFGRRYGDGRRLALVPASIALMERADLDIHNVASLPPVRNLVEVDLEELCKTIDPVVSGRVVGAIRIPFGSEDPYAPIDYVGHVILDQVELVNVPLTSLPQQRLYVPIEGHEALLLFG